MGTDSKDNDLIKVAPTTIARYSNALVKRAIQDIERISTQPSPPIRTKKRILVLVDPDPLDSSRQLLAEVLGAVDFDSVFLGPYNQLELGFAELSRTQYDMIIPTNFTVLSKYMPELIAEIKKRFKTIKIVVISGHSPIDFVNDLFKKGIDDFFTIPFDVKDLVTRVKELLADGHPRVYESRRNITLLLPYYFIGDAFAILFDNLGFKVSCSKNAQDTLRIVRSSQFDLAIEWQHGDEDFPIRDVLKAFGRNTSVFLALNWNNKAPANLEELGYAGTLVVPFDSVEMRHKFLEKLPLTRRDLFRQTKLWNDPNA